MKITRITEPYKRGNPIIIILSLVTLAPVGLIGFIFSLFMLPVGILLLPFAFIIMSMGFAPLFKVSKAMCPHCNSIISVGKKAKIFKCRSCRRKISKIGNMLEGL